MWRPPFSPTWTLWTRGCSCSRRAPLGTCLQPLTPDIPWKKEVSEHVANVVVNASSTHSQYWSVYNEKSILGCHVQYVLICASRPLLATQLISLNATEKLSGREGGGVRYKLVWALYRQLSLFLYHFLPNELLPKEFCGFFLKSYW